MQLERPAGHALGHWRALVRDGADEGRRNDTIASLTGHLLWHGVDPDVVLELMRCWNRIRCRPPLPVDEVEGVVRSIARAHGRTAAPLRRPGCAAIGTATRPSSATPAPDRRARAGVALPLGLTPAGNGMGAAPPWDTANPWPMHLHRGSAGSMRRR